MIHRYRLLLIAALFILAGCGKNVAPPPPKARADLVLSLYDAMRNRRHEDALRKIDRLREIAPSNVFLANLEKLERNNSILKRAQMFINAGDLKGASECVSNGIVKYGRYPELMTAKKKLDIANRIKAILDVFKKPYDSNSLKKNAKDLLKIASTYKPAAIYLPVADSQLKRAERLRDWENRCAVEGLCSEIATCLESGKEDKQSDIDVNVLYAVLEIADPKNDAVREFREYISGKTRASLNIYKEEDIFDSLNPPSEDDETTVESESNSDSTSLEKSSAKERKDDMKVKEEVKKKDTGGWWQKFSF